MHIVASELHRELLKPGAVLVVIVVCSKQTFKFPSMYYFAHIGRKETYGRASPL